MAIPPPPQPIPSLLKERGTAAATRDALAFRFVDRFAETQATATYGQLFQRSAFTARALERAGVARGDPVVLLMESRLEFYFGLFGAMLLGALPVAVYPPASQQQLVPALDHLRKVVRGLPARAILTTQLLYGVADQVRTGRVSVLALDRTEALDEPREWAGERVEMQEPALLQYTSGSLADPKAIELSTANIFANLVEIGDAFGMREGDAGLSWLPLYHDMGLHSAFFDLMFRMPLTVMSPLEFIRRPAGWLKAVSRYQATHSPAPSFGYAYAARRVKDEELEGVDLSRWRVAMCGAEAIDGGALRRFGERFGRFGFKASAFQGAYGLAENTVAVSFVPPGDGLREIRLDGDALGQRGVVVERPDGRAIASVGPPISGHRVRVVEPGGSEVPEGTQGEIEVQGPSRMLGYRGNAETTRESFRGEWLRTGDLGFVKDGELYVTGRIKDLIIRGGKNYYPQDLEAAAAGVEGVRPGAVAAFGRTEPVKGTEEIVVVAEVRTKDLLAREAQIADALRKAIFEGTGLSVNHVRMVEPGVVPRTTSGKLRRGECRARFEAGKLTLPPPPGLALLAKVGLLRVLPEPVKRAWERVRRWL